MRAWVPAFAGMTARARSKWVPAFAGMTGLAIFAFRRRQLQEFDYFADIEYGRCDEAVAQSLFGCACIVNLGSPPAMISPCSMYARDSGLPLSVALPM